MIYVLILLAVGALGLWIMARLARRTENEKGIGDETRADGPVLGGARLGPDGTNVDPPETFVVHHEGKGQSLDIANTALKKRTEKVTSDLPGDIHAIKSPIPGRQHAQAEVPSDESPFGDVKVPPLEGGDTKDHVLREGPIGSRPGTPEEPGSPLAKGERITFDRQNPFGPGQTKNQNDQNGWSGPNPGNTQLQNQNTNKAAAGPGTSVQGGFTATAGGNWMQGQNNKAQGSLPAPPAGNSPQENSQGNQPGISNQYGQQAAPANMPSPPPQTGAPDTPSPNEAGSQLH